jgi:hypothetical protein
MNWKVTYRAKNGKTAEELFAADNRDELFKTLAAKGISAIRIEESKRPAQKSQGSARKTGRVALVATAAVLLAALGIFVAKHFSGGRDDTRPSRNEEKHRKITTVAPATAASKSADMAPVPAPAAKPEQPKREMWLGREIVSTKTVTNGTDLIITRVDTDGKIHKEYTSIHKRLFSNPVDIVLSILLTTPEGALTPPLPPLGPRSGDLFAESLKKPIEITDDDTPEDKRIKQLVIAAREEMLEELRNGKTVDEVIDDHCTFVDENNRLRAEAMVRYKEMIAEGDEDLAEEFREKANEMLVGKGAAPLRSLAEIHEERISNREKK